MFIGKESSGFSGSQANRKARQALESARQSYGESPDAATREGQPHLGFSPNRRQFDSFEAVQQGASILFFPEGTRSPDGRLRPFKIGAFRTAVDEGLPVLPILLRGTEHLHRKGQLDLSLDTSREVEIEFLPLMRPPPPELGEPKVRAELLRDDVYGQFSRRLASA